MLDPRINTLTVRPRGRWPAVVARWLCCCKQPNDRAQVLSADLERFRNQQWYRRRALLLARVARGPLSYHLEEWMTQVPRLPPCHSAGLLARSLLQSPL